MLPAKSIKQRVRTLLKKIGLEHADERTQRDVGAALKSAWSAGHRTGADAARFIPGPKGLR